MSHAPSPQSVETAVPLLMKQQQEQQEDGNQVVQAAESQDDEVGSASNCPKDKVRDYIPLWYINFAMGGVILGFYTTGVMVMSLHYSYVHFGEVPTFSHLAESMHAKFSVGHHDNNSNHHEEQEYPTMPYGQFFALWSGIHFAGIVYVAVCILMAYMLTPSGSHRMVHLFDAYLDSGNCEQWTAQSVFRCIVVLAGGVVFGSSCMILTTEAMIGVKPISLTPFLVTLAFNVAICSLLFVLFKCHDLISHNDEKNNGQFVVVKVGCSFCTCPDIVLYNDDEDNGSRLDDVVADIDHQHQEECPYIAIV